MEAWRQVGTTVAEVHWRLLQVEVVCVCLCVCAQSYPTLCNPWTVGHQAPLSMGFSRQEYWTGLPFPPPGDLPDPGIEPASPALAGRFSITALLGKPGYQAEVTSLKKTLLDNLGMFKAWNKGSVAGVDRARGEYSRITWGSRAGVAAYGALSMRRSLNLSSALKSYRRITVMSIIQ